MDNESQETLNRVEQNDATLTKLKVSKYQGFAIDGGSKFFSTESSDYSRLGSLVAENTHLTHLVVSLTDNTPLDDETGTTFCEGLKRNSSLHELTLDCSKVCLDDGTYQEILKVYQEKSNLTSLCIGFHYSRGRIHFQGLEYGGEHVITTIRNCTALREINLGMSGMTDNQLLPLIEAVKGHNMLEDLLLYGNEIGQRGCRALATLLEDPNCNIDYLNLNSNQINNVGATAILGSLTKNTKLKELRLYENHQIDEGIEVIFTRLLCNTSSINSIYESNHVLNDVQTQCLVEDRDPLASLLKMNKDINKVRVAMKKILQNVPDIDMEPLFELDLEAGERNLKALPYVIAQFDRARDNEEYLEEDESVSDGSAASEEEGSVSESSSCSKDPSEENSSAAEGRSVSSGCIIDQQKLSAIFQFASALPLFFIPASHSTKTDNNKKRKRDNVQT